MTAEISEKFDFFPKQGKEFWAQPISLFESVKGSSCRPEPGDDRRVLNPADIAGLARKTTTQFS